MLQNVQLKRKLSVYLCICILVATSCREICDISDFTCNGIIRLVWLVWIMFDILRTLLFYEIPHWYRNVVYVKFYCVLFVVFIEILTLLVINIIFFIWEYISMVD